jgi:hypothetical protein
VDEDPDFHLSTETNPLCTFRVLMGGPENTEEITSSFDFPFNPYITEANFPSKGRGESWEDEIVVLDPRCSFNEPQGLRILHDIGLDRPTCEHALRFAQQHARTTVSDDKPFIVFLHEPWRDSKDRPHVLCLDRHSEFPALSLAFPDAGLDARFVMAGVRRVSSRLG